MVCAHGAQRRIRKQARLVPFIIRQEGGTESRPWNRIFFFETTWFTQTCPKSDVLISIHDAFLSGLSNQVTSMKDNPYQPGNQTGFNEIHISKTCVIKQFFLSGIEKLKHHDKLYVLFFPGWTTRSCPGKIALTIFATKQNSSRYVKRLVLSNRYVFSEVEKLKNHDELHFYLWWTTKSRYIVYFLSGVNNEVMSTKDYPYHPRDETGFN